MGNASGNENGNESKMNREKMGNENRNESEFKIDNRSGNEN